MLQKYLISNQQTVSVKKTPEIYYIYMYMYVQNVQCTALRMYIQCIHTYMYIQLLT